MDYQLSTVRTAVQNRLDDSQYSTVVIDQFANDVNRDVCNSRQWRFMQKLFSGTIETDSSSYDFPDDYQVPFSFRITAPDNSSSFLQYMSFEAFDQAYPDPSSAVAATPIIWYPFANTFNLYPTPDQNYTVDLRYLKSPAVLTADADVPDIPEAFQEVLVLGIYQKCLERENQIWQAQAIQYQYVSAVTDMVKRLQTDAFGSSIVISNPRWSNTRA